MTKIKDTNAAVLELINKIRIKKAEIASAKKKPQWKTNVTVRYNPGSPESINLMTVRDRQTLIDIYSFIISREQRAQQAANDLGFTETPTYLGYSFAEWKADIKSRAAQLTLDEKEKELAALSQRAEALLSPEQRRELELEALLKEVE